MNYPVTLVPVPVPGPLHMPVSDPGPDPDLVHVPDPVVAMHVTTIEHESGQAMLVGMAADSGATRHVIGQGIVSEGRVYGRRGLSNPVRVVTGNGTVWVAESGKVQINGRVYEGWVMEESGVSLMSVRAMCEEGWTYSQTRDRAKLTREGEVIYLSMKGGLWLEEDMPGGSMGPNPEQTLTTDLEQIGVEAAAFLAAVEGYALAHATGGDSAGGRGHTKRCHYPHTPKCRHCMAGRMLTQGKEEEGEEGS